MDAKKMSNPLHFTLKSGRVLFLKKPLTAEELAECQTDAGMAILEMLADDIARRATTSISSDSPEGQAMLRKHNIHE
jgi:hypothetical protein